MVDVPSIGLPLLTAGGVLLVTVVVGVIAHETAHAIVLRAFDIEYDVDVHPTDTVSGTELPLVRPLVTVTPRPRSPSLSSVGVRLAAIAPLTLAAPFLLVLAGVVPDPLAVGNPVVAAATVGWAGCAIPSPQDFSVFWHGNRTPTGQPEEG
jgi:hypothetical protein